MGIIWDTNKHKTFASTAVNTHIIEVKYLITRLNFRLSLMSYLKISENITCKTHYRADFPSGVGVRRRAVGWGAESLHIPLQLLS